MTGSNKATSALPPLVALIAAALVALPLVTAVAGCSTVTGAKETVVDPAKDTNPKGEPGAKTPGGAAREDSGRM